MDKLTERLKTLRESKRVSTGGACPRISTCESLW
ncbi:hypothetical protein MAMMFC1_02362 [Methylomusa anaerophila]|uniref:Uncharacterized protein n=1 Tax=Methylomusa anaerophila TaxID=1930071 RepID=A0A348AKT0_9FIRM|nr:hypothetical protein MAMMFC1_02362 [Methylomusa anaerophila]